MIYLASPYSDLDPAVREQRYYATARFVAHEIWLGVPLFSPICYTHYMAIQNNLPLDAESWRPFNEYMIRNSFEVWVLRLPGWQKSLGVNMEINLANELDIPVIFKDKICA